MMLDYLIDCFIGLLTAIGYILLGLVILAVIGMIAAIVMAFVEDRKGKKNGRK